MPTIDFYAAAGTFLLLGELSATRKYLTRVTLFNFGG
jgi:hypothetical protein